MKAYLEKILDGRVVPWFDSRKNTLVRQIEDKEEFDDMPEESRGIIANRKLYMLTNPQSDVTHTMLKDHLQRLGYIHGDYGYTRIDMFMMVQKHNNTLYAGESYDNKQLTASFIRQMQSQLDSIKYLGIKTSTDRIIEHWNEANFEDSKYEKILVSKELRHIKGKKPNYRMPWKKMLSKANGTYSYIGESEEEKVRRGAIIPYAIEDGEVYIALMKPSDPKYGGNDFQIAKGIQEPGESIEKTAIREGEQELGLDLPNNIKLIWDNKRGGITYFFVKVEMVGLKPKENEEGIMETGSAKWFTINEAEKIIRDWQKPIIQMLMRRLGI